MHAADRIWRCKSSVLAYLLAVGLPLFLLWGLILAAKQAEDFSFSANFISVASVVSLLGLSSLPPALLLALLVLAQNRSERKDVLREILGFVGRLPVFLIAILLLNSGQQPWITLSIAFSLPFAAQLAEQLQDYPAYYKELSYSFGGVRLDLLRIILTHHRLHLLQILLRQMVRISGEFLVVLYFIHPDIRQEIFLFTDPLDNTGFPMIFLTYLLVALLFLLLQIPVKFLQRSAQRREAPSV